MRRRSIRGGVVGAQLSSLSRAVVLAVLGFVAKHGMFGDTCPGDALKKEIKEFPVLIMDLPQDSELVPKLQRHQERLTGLAEKPLATIGWTICVLK